MAETTTWPDVWYKVEPMQSIDGKFRDAIDGVKAYLKEIGKYDEEKGHRFSVRLNTQEMAIGISEKLTDDEQSRIGEIGLKHGYKYVISEMGD